MQFERLQLLIKDQIATIKNKCVLVIGLGGVGGYAVETLVRSGIGKIIIIDNDIIDITNLNRQIIALHSNIGMKKVDACEKRMKDINPSCEIIKIEEFVTAENIDMLFNHNPDYIIDACDTINTKKEIIHKCLEKKIKFISSMGTGNKLDPSKLEILDIRKTCYDPIAKTIRKMINDEKIKDKIYVVCSKEPPIKTNSKIIGSTAFVPATAGLLCASFVINDIIKENYEGTK